MENKIITRDQAVRMATIFYVAFCNGKETKADCKECKMFKTSCTFSKHRNK